MRETSLLPRITKRAWLGSLCAACIFNACATQAVLSEDGLKPFELNVNQAGPLSRNQSPSSILLKGNLTDTIRGALLQTTQMKDTSRGSPKNIRPKFVIMDEPVVQQEIMNTPALKGQLASEHPTDGQSTVITEAPLAEGRLFSLDATIENYDVPPLLEAAVEVMDSLKLQADVSKSELMFRPDLVREDPTLAQVPLTNASPSALIPFVDDTTPAQSQVLIADTPIAQLPVDADRPMPSPVILHEAPAEPSPEFAPATVFPTAAPELLEAPSAPVILDAPVRIAHQPSESAVIVEPPIAPTEASDVAGRLLHVNPALAVPNRGSAMRESTSTAITMRKPLRALAQNLPQVPNESRSVNASLKTRPRVSPAPHTVPVKLTTGPISWDEWFERVGQLCDRRLMSVLERRGNPAGNCTVLLSVKNDRTVGVVLDDGDGDEFISAAVEAYGSISGDPLLEFPPRSREKIQSFKVKNAQSDAGPVIEINGIRIRGFVEPGGR